MEKKELSRSRIINCATPEDVEIPLYIMEMSIIETTEVMNESQQNDLEEIVRGILHRVANLKVDDETFTNWIQTYQQWMQSMRTSNKLFVSDADGRSGFAPRDLEAKDVDAVMALPHKELENFRR